MESTEERIPLSAYEKPLSETLSKWWSLFWPRRYRFVLIVAAFSIFGVVLAYVLPKYYTTQAEILSPGFNSLSADASTQLSAIMGMSFDGGNNIAPTYPKLAKSRRILKEVLKSDFQNGTYADAVSKYCSKKSKSNSVHFEKLLRSLQENISASMDLKSRIVKIKLTLRDPHLAAAFLNEIIHQMDMFFRYQLITEAKNQRLVLEKRLAEISDSLRFAESSLLKFKESNRTTSLSPKLQMEEARLRREVEIKNVIYLELNRQYELIKIKEAGNTPVMNVMDWAYVPIHHSSPKRRRVVAVSFLLGVFLALAYIRLDEFVDLKTLLKRKS